MGNKIYRQAERYRYTCFTNFFNKQSVYFYTYQIRLPIDNIYVTKILTTMTVKKYYWDPNTIEYFVDVYDLNGEYHMMNRIIEYVKYECQLEDGETHQDLITDLHDRVTEAIEKDDNRKL